MSIPFPQAQLAQPVPSNAPSLTQFPTSTTGHLLPLSPNPDSYHRNPYYHGHSRSGSLAPSPAPPAPMSQGDHSRPRTHSHSSDHRHHHHHHHHRSQSPHGQSRSHSRSHSHGRSPSGHGSRSVTPAPPLLVSQHSEPIAPYVMMPTAATYATSEYQPQYAAQLGDGYAFAPPPVASVPVPLPSPAPATVPRGIPSPLAASVSMPGQTRALQVSQVPRSRGRKPLLSREVDAPDPPRRDWRSHPLFRHSRCTGRRKALCVGINYTGQRNELHGCVNDAKNIYQFLMEHHRYPHSNIIVLTDDNPNPRAQPTRKNMMNSMRWLVEDARPDDALFIHYSGHGGRTRDLDGDELDGWDEVIFPVDYKTAGVITDDVLHETLVRPLPPGCRLTAVFDSCHSGSILDIVFEFHSNGRPKSSPVSRAFQQAKSTPGDVICFSGSKDSQTSADVVQGGVAVGAMSYAFLKVLKRNPQITYIDLLRGVREILNKKYSQKPQLSASHQIDINMHFVM